METKKIELTCIGCPMGCPLIVTMEDGAVASVTVTEFTLAGLSACATKFAGSSE